MSELTRVSGPSGQRFRPDIQGLRAVAVLLVVAFHAGLPFPGGFVGVDVFFVISGYVITNMLLREWHEYGHIRLGRFWRRRFFRLTPALALMIAVTFVFSALILFPSEQRIAFQTGIGALFLVANVVIARNTGGYFDAAAEKNPLLNTWSLSVEEQFYLVFPLLLVAALIAWRRSSRLSWAPIAVVGCVGAFSFALTLWGQTSSGQLVTALNFYSPFTRSWEFAAGSVLALATWGRLPLKRFWGELLAVAGGLGLLGAVFLIGPSTPFPSAWTLIPVVSTTMLIAGGNAIGRRQRLLTNSVMVRIGDWSYSIYLWHWPLIVFAIALGFWQSTWLALAAIASLVPAVLSYRFVEQPLRQWSPRLKAARVWAAVGIIAVPVALAPVLLANATPSPRFDGAVGTRYLETIEATSFPCDIAQVPGSGSRCYQSKAEGPIDTVVVGDSHAEHLYLGVRSLRDDLNVAYVYLPNWPYETSANTQLTFETISDAESITSVIINSRWDKDGASSAELARAMKQLASPGRSIFLADDGPTFSFNAEECQYERIIGPRPRCEEDSNQFDQRYLEYRPLLDALAIATPGASLLETSGGFCRNGMCSMTQGDVLMYADHGHLNQVGSERVMRRLLESDERFKASIRAAS